jgi:hypothetical protein
VTFKFNGWRRIAVTLIIVWFACIGLIIPIDMPHNTRIFVTKGLPYGLIVKADKIIYPDGTEIKFNGINPKSGERLKPWEIDWDKNPELKREIYVDWTHVSMAMLLPILLWAITEGALANLKWIKKGFDK